MKKKFTPPWKRIVLTQRDWPTHMRMPMEDLVPARAEVVYFGNDEGNSWNWELLRESSGRSYFLRAWLVSSRMSFGNKAEKLSPKEAFWFCIQQFIQPQLLADVRRVKKRTR